MRSALLEAQDIDLHDDAHVSTKISHAARSYDNSPRTQKVQHLIQTGHLGVGVLEIPEDETAASDHQEVENPPTPGQLILDEFDAIHAKYHRRIYRQCFRMVRNPDDAEDLTQEVFLLLYRKAHTFRGEANFSTWLHRLTINTVLMRLRSHRRWRQSVSSFDVVPGPDHDSNENPTLASAIPAPPTSPVEKIELDIALSQLSAGYREVFLLHDAEGYRHDEIAKMLGISEGTSKSQLHKARSRMRQLVESGSRRPSKSVRGPAEEDESESNPLCALPAKVIPATRRLRNLHPKTRLTHKESSHRAAA